MKKIITSVGMIVFVGALIVGGTGAFFSDTETSVGNVFTAGAIDLQIDNSSYGFDWNDPTVQDPVGEWGLNENNSWALTDLDNELFFNFTDLKPGDYGEDTISIHVNNNDAYACMALNLTGTPENGQNEPEADVDTTAGADEGELQEYLSFLFWNDDGDNVLEVGETLVDGLNGLSGDIFTGDWLAISEGGDAPLPGGTTNYLGKGWCFGDITATPVAIANPSGPTPGNTGFTCTGAEGDHNDAQTDGINVDVSFYAVQSRNNDGFSCAALPPLGGVDPDPEPEVLVGAVLGDYVAPDVCTQTVSGSGSIQAAENSAVPNSTICVEPSYDGTGDNSAIRIEVLGLTLAAKTQGVNLDVPVVLSNSNVTVTGFDGTIGQAESPAEQAAFYLDSDADNAEISFNSVVGVGSGAAILNETGAVNTGSLIANNVLSGALQGIYLNPHTGTITIEYNDFYDNVVGIGNLNGALVQNNEFNHSALAQEAIGAGNGALGDYDNSVVQFNNFLGDTRINTYTLTGDVDAPNNFFGPNGGAAQAPVDVDFTPESLVQYTHN